MFLVLIALGSNRYENRTMLVARMPQLTPLIASKWNKFLKLKEKGKKTGKALWPLTHPSMALLNLVVVQVPRGWGLHGKSSVAMARQPVIELCRHSITR